MLALPSDLLFGDLVLSDPYCCTRCSHEVVSNRYHQDISLPLFDENTSSELFIDLQITLRDNGSAAPLLLFVLLWTPGVAPLPATSPPHLSPRCCINNKRKAGTDSAPVSPCAGSLLWICGSKMKGLLLNPHKSTNIPDLPPHLK